MMQIETLYQELKLKDMTQEEKDLLLKDLCSKLPYGVKAYVKNWSKLDRKYYEGTYIVRSIHPSLSSVFVCSDKASVEVILGYDDYDFKPYLFPLSSMTDEQKEEFLSVAQYEAREEDCGRHTETYYYDMVGHERNFYPNSDAIDWLNAHHFDYRGLIEKELAIDATGLNIY